jgi:putative sterol carrier protein
MMELTKWVGERLTIQMSTFAASDEDWVAMSNKTLKVQWAYLTGRLKIQGSHSLVKKLDEIFP